MSWKKSATRRRALERIERNCLRKAVGLVPGTSCAAAIRDTLDRRGSGTNSRWTSNMSAPVRMTKHRRQTVHIASKTRLTNLAQWRPVSRLQRHSPLNQIGKLPIDSPSRLYPKSDEAEPSLPVDRWVGGACDNRQNSHGRHRAGVIPRCEYTSLTRGSRPPMWDTDLRGTRLHFWLRKMNAIRLKSMTRTQRVPPRSQSVASPAVPRREKQDPRGEVDSSVGAGTVSDNRHNFQQEQK